MAVAQAPRNAPPGWALVGSAGAAYSATVDHVDAYSGAASALLASRAAYPKGFGALYQGIRTAAYLGKRIRYSARVRITGVEDWAGLWFRVDGPDGAVQAFDNMQAPLRRLQGDSGWQEYSIVADVSRDAADICYGVLLNGGGKVWIDSIRIEVVARDVPTTTFPVDAGGRLIIPPESLLPEPRNLDFEE